MPSELDTPFTIVSPATGEVLTLESSTDDLAEWLLDVRDWEAQAQAAKRVVSGELLSRLDKTASWTQHFPERGIKISGDSPAPSEQWDGAELREFLLELVDDEVITIEAVDAVVETVISYKVKKAGINSLRKLGGRAGEVVDALCREQERDRRITVTRA
jgi:hypothetical protein